MDIDEILKRAETQEISGEESATAHELLSQFKVASFAMGEEELGGDFSDNEGRRMSISNESKPHPPYYNFNNFFQLLRIKLVVIRIGMRSFRSLIVRKWKKKRKKESNFSFTYHRDKEQLG